MFIVYYISVTTVGTVATDWANDGVFGDGWHLFGIGAGEYEDVSGEFGDAANVIDAFVTAEGADDVADAIDTESLQLPFLTTQQRITPSLMKKRWLKRMSLTQAQSSRKRLRPMRPTAAKSRIRPITAFGFRVCRASSKAVWTL